MSRFEEIAKLSGHIVICGWKDGIDLILEEVLRINPDLNSKHFVWITKMPQDYFNTNIANKPLLKDLYWIKDDYINEDVLKKVAIERARRVIILADRVDRVLSATETDSRTVMAAMAVEKLAPQVYIVAELLDLDFLQYLKMAHVDEVIYSREYSRTLIATTLASPGVAHTVMSFLEGEGSMLDTIEIPDDFMHKSFKELFEYYQFMASPRAILIGILENTGNLQTLKRLALSSAQKNPDTRKVLRDLSLVKNLETNRPVLNPSDDYIIQTNSLAIVIREIETVPPPFHYENR